MMNERIKVLKKELALAVGIGERRIADRIRSTGFKCRHCAQCCKAEYGDNTVNVFPFEIKRICEKTGLEAEQIVIPAPSEDKDREGNIHTFEWVLRNKGDCIFLKNDLCGIYECRPHICRTYPFYLRDGRLMVSECGGTGNVISEEESLRIAALLKERYIMEIKESIALLERFRGFKPHGRGNICIHDSEGEHWIPPSVTSFKNPREY